MIENPYTPEAVAYNLSQLILSKEKGLTKDKILSTYSECLSVVKGHAIITNSVKTKVSNVIDYKELGQKPGGGTTKG